MVTKKTASKKKPGKKKPPSKKRTTSTPSSRQPTQKSLSNNQVDLDGCGTATYEGNTLVFEMSEDEGCEVTVEITVHASIHSHCVWNGTEWVCD